MPCCINKTISYGLVGGSVGLAAVPMFRWLLVQIPWVIVLLRPKARLLTAFAAGTVCPLGCMLLRISAVYVHLNSDLSPKLHCKPNAALPESLVIE